ncbi:MAG: hypothetical protein DME19_16335 [Verrucomicrobia bacterium]|nr:MAG: hypothetical protein DME19_16335 [Verrucomicrobiota bacterium]
MPIRINLLAEQQAAEDLRRRDPVKRALWVAGLIVGVMVVWSGRLQIKLMAATSEINRYESEWKKLEPDYKKVTANFDKAADAELKWAALHALATNRFLWARPLNALQYVIAKVDDLQVLRLNTEQSYAITEGTKPTTNSFGNVTRGKPATSRERVMFTIDAKDSSKRPGDQVFKLQGAISDYAEFKTNLQTTELKIISPEQADPNSPTKRFVTFTLECRYTEKTR